MCTFSVIADDFMHRHPQRSWPSVIPAPITQPDKQAEIDALRKELEALRALLKAALAFDAATGQKDCEDATKVAFLRDLGQRLGVDLSEVLDHG